MATRWTTIRRFSFNARHQLTAGIGTNHIERGPHGHTYVIDVHISGSDLKLAGWLIDPAQLNPFETWVKQNLVNKDLNVEIPRLLGQPGCPTTPEYIAMACKAQLVKMGFPEADVHVSDSMIWVQMEDIA